MTAVDLTALPPKARAAIYYAYSVVGLGLGATQVGYSAASAGQPTALTVALSVFAFLGVGLGLTAASNTPSKAGAGQAAVAPIQDGDEYDPKHDGR